MCEVERTDVTESTFRTELEHHAASSFRSNNSNSESSAKLQWAAIERLPTFERIKTSLFDLDNQEDGLGRRVVDVTQLGALERHVFMEKLLTRIEQDNHVLLNKLKKRIDRVGLKMPTVEVRFKNLCIEAESEVVHGRSLPTLWNSFKHTFSFMRNMSGCKSPATKIKILKNVSGVIKPSRMALLLGPPGCGKTTLLQALSGKSDHSLQVMGEISYNGYKLEEFVPQKTSAYVSQDDLHISEMTVRETLDFSARCQGIGTRADIMVEVSKREKQAGIIPEPDIDTYMKAVSVEGLKRTLQTDYILKILGLDICADTIVGDAMTRGISGGQKKRLTTGEMMIGPTKALLMDEISNGIDSSTTLQIVTCLQQLSHISESTILVSLLQPSPETFDLFDDVILMAEGQIVYHGPRDDVVPFFEQCGFRCPPRKGIADFLQEVVSEKDQGQYWYHEDQPHDYVSVDKFVKAFHESHVGQNLDQQLSQPFIKSESHKNALTTNVYSVRNWELFKACMSREWLLMKRNSFIHIFKSAQLMVVAIVTMTTFIRTNMKTDIAHANFYMGSLFYSILRLSANGIAELSLTVSRLPVFYKQRDLYFYPPWTYAIPSIILKIPFSLFDAFLWTALTYYVIGYSPQPARFLYQFLVFFLVHLVSQSLFRTIASFVRSPPIAAAAALYILLVMFLFGGFIIPQSSMPNWLQWGFWISPLTYAEIAFSLNEFLAPRWQKGSSSNGTTLGDQILRNYGLHFSHWFYMISAGALLAFWMFFNIGFTCALTFLGTPSRSQTIISQQNSSVAEGSEEETKMGEKRQGTVLPFEPTSISFQNVHYFVDSPKKHGMGQKKLQLLKDISGAFRPGVLTALMGVSGAGKTTLMDVLSGRKTGGVIEGEIRVGGYLKVQETYARISGYCEQTDIHSSQLTVQESVMYSAKLRLPPQIDTHKRSAFVGEVLRMLELEEIKDGLVGINGVSGISNEQRKRLTIAVELVSNPSIIFMDEPTTGLDARAAAIVMRVVKNIVTTGRTVVCTIHQPSIHIFEAFDELILLKQGGQVIYSGEIGQHSSKLIQYFQSISGVPKVKHNYNPATWMLEVTSPSAETQLGVDFAHLYRNSHLFKENEEVVKELNVTAQRSELKFSSDYPQNGWEQFKACLWKLHLSYWRSPNYNLVRFTFIAASSVLFAALLWRKGQEIRDEKDLSNILGALFVFMQMSGVCNCSTVLPYIAKERNVLYRERFAGMYSSWAYSIAQVTIEIPYIFFQTVVFVIVTYPCINFYWSAYKVLWYMYTMLCTLLYYNYLGMLLVSVTPTFQVASVLASFIYTMLNLFSGFLIPGPRIPKWWVWCYWICPTAWSLKGFLISQYGDVEEQITFSNSGEQLAINDFLASYYGYHRHDLGIVAIVLFAFPLLFAFSFSYCIANINFQKR